MQAQPAMTRHANGCIDFDAYRDQAMWLRGDAIRAGCRRVIVRLSAVAIFAVSCFAIAPGIVTDPSGPYGR